MPLQFIISNRGKRQLLHNGFIYLKEKQTIDKTIWRCIEYESSRCLGRCHTANNEVIWSSDNHNHVVQTAKIKAKQIRIKVKELASTQQENPQQIIANATICVESSVTAALPPPAALTRTIQRIRRNATNPIPDPVNLRQLEIPRHCTVTYNEEQFLLFDSGPGDERILLFSTQRNLNLLAQCPHWFADGTFKTTPLLFTQVYTVHGIKYNSVIPAVFALLPNKRTDTYIRFLNELKNLNPNLQPVSILTDFEQPAVNAFQDVFPGIQNRGCFFHFSQCIWRKIQENGDIRNRYEDVEDPNFSLCVRELAALAFVPPADVIRCFEELKEFQFFRENEFLLRPLLDYFEDTWIGRPTGANNIRRNPLFSIQLWNCFQATLEGLPKTNNSVEGWHRSFASLLQAHHPSLWKFIDGLKKEQSLNELKIEQYLSGIQPVLGRRTYRETAHRIQSVVREYGNQDLEDFLRGISHNFELQAHS